VHNTDVTEHLTAAVVGAGYWGPNLIRNFASSRDWRLRWVCDTNIDRARAVIGDHSTIRATDSLEEILNDSAVDAVAIATPPATHAPLAEAAIAAGKHVLVEKPLARTLSQARSLVQQADLAGVILMADHTYCYTPSVEYIREALRTGELGRLLFYDSVRINLGLVQTEADVLWDLAPHDLAILDYVLPEKMAPTAVSATGVDPIGAGVACVAHITLHLPEESLAHIHVNWLSPTKVRTTILGGSDRTLVWDDLTPGQRINIYERGVDLEWRDDLDLEQRSLASVSYRSGPLIAPALAETEALSALVSDFAHSVRTGRPPRSDGRSALRILHILEAASRSMRFDGAVVPLGGCE
jgi:predicted dehydrogenase